MGSQVERRILQLTTLEVISQIITLQTSIEMGRKPHLKMSRDLRRERRKVLCPKAHLLMLLGSSWAVDVQKTKTKQNSLERHNFSLHIKEAPRWASQAILPTSNHQGPGSFHLSSPILSHEPASQFKTAALLPTHHLHIPVGEGSGVERSMCYLPLKAFPGNSVHLSHWSELNHVA